MKGSERNKQVNKTRQTNRVQIGRPHFIELVCFECHIHVRYSSGTRSNTTLCQPLTVGTFSLIHCNKIFFLAAYVIIQYNLLLCLDVSYVYIVCIVYSSHCFCTVTGAGFLISLYMCTVTIKAFYSILFYSTLFYVKCRLGRPSMRDTGSIASSVPNIFCFNELKNESK